MKRNIDVVPLAALEAVANWFPKVAAIQQSGRNGGAPFDVDAFIQRHGIAVRREKPWNGGRMFLLEHCIFDPAHGGTSAMILQALNGAMVYRCLHNGCVDRSWRDVREH